MLQIVKATELGNQGGGGAGYLMCTIGKSGEIRKNTCVFRPLSLLMNCVSPLVKYIFQQVKYITP